MAFIHSFPSCFLPLRLLVCHVCAYVCLFVVYIWGGVGVQRRVRGTGYGGRVYIGDAVCTIGGSMYTV